MRPPAFRRHGGASGLVSVYLLFVCMFGRKTQILKLQQSARFNGGSKKKEVGVMEEATTVQLLGAGS